MISGRKLAFSNIRDSRELILSSVVTLNVSLVDLQSVMPAFKVQTSAWRHPEDRSSLRAVCKASDVSSHPSRHVSMEYLRL